MAWFASLVLYRQALWKACTKCQGYRPSGSIYFGRLSFSVFIGVTLCTIPQGKTSQHTHTSHKGWAGRGKHTHNVFARFSLRGHTAHTTVHACPSTRRECPTWLWMGSLVPMDWPCQLSAGLSILFSRFRKIFFGPLGAPCEGRPSLGRIRLGHFAGPCQSFFFWDSTNRLGTMPALMKRASSRLSGNAPNASLECRNAGTMSITFPKNFYIFIFNYFRYLPTCLESFSKVQWFQLVTLSLSCLYVTHARAYAHTCGHMRACEWKCAICLKIEQK